MSEEERAAWLDLHDGKIDVRRYFERILHERDRTNVERERRVDDRFRAYEKHLDERFQSQQVAIDKAETSARETLKSHNDLIRQSRDRDATYATQADLENTEKVIGRMDQSLSRIIGGLILVSFMVPVVSGIIAWLVGR